MVESYTEEDFKNTITFINHTAKLLWNDTKYAIIVNRQNSKWNNVKTILRNLELFCERDVYHILLLKPQGFLQRHFGGNDPKQMKKLTKHETIIIENISMLEQYVDLSELPEEFGGYHSFNVLEWVEYTTAVERFQSTCEKVAKRIKDMQILFSNKIALSSVEAVEFQARQQSQLVEDIKDDVKCTVEIADTLAPIVNKPLSHSLRNQSPLERYNSAQLQVCSDQLLTFTSDIEKLWAEQCIYHEQAKEVCNFEEKFGKISIKLLQITSILESREDIGDTLSSAKELMDELDDFELKRKEPYEEMMKLKESGIQMLVLFASFAHEPVRLRLDEVKVLIKRFEVKLEARRDLLQISLDVFQCLDKLITWCKNGVDLLASQPVEAFNTEEGAKKCLGELDQFMKNGQGINMKKMNQLNMLCKKLQNKMIDEKVATALNRIEEVKVMLERRESSLKKVASKPVRPVQPVKALVINKDVLVKKNPDKTLPRIIKSPLSPVPPASPVTKKEIEVVVTDNLEKNKRNKTFRKSLRMSVRRPLSSPAQLQLAEYEEDPENRKKIRHVITELIDTELVYVNDLRHVLEGYYVAFDDSNFDIPPFLRSQKAAIFGNIKEIYQFHSGNFVEELAKCKEAPYLSGQVFMDKKEEFQLYATYCKNKPKSEALRKELHNTTFPHECQKRLGHQLNLDSYLLKPVQRITKYRLLLTEILKYVSKKNPAHADIMDALHTMKKVLRHVNDVMHSSGLVGFNGNLDDQGKLVLQDPFTVWESKKHTIKQFTKLGAKNRQVFLFEKCLIFSKRDVENGKELSTYQYKRSVETANIGVTENVKGDECKFELWVHGSSDVYYLQAQNTDVKNNWLAEMRKILMSQFQGVKARKASRDDLHFDTLTKEDIRNKLKFLHPSLSGSVPILSQTNEIEPYEPSSSNKSTLHSSSTSNVAELEVESDDSVWSDSEFDEEVDEIDEGEALPTYDDTENVYSNNNTTTFGVTSPISQNHSKSHWYTDLTSESSIDQSEIGANTFCATADYTAVEDTEISFQCGALINLIKEGDSGWWYCKNLHTRHEGWAPNSYLEIYAVDITETQVEPKKVEPVKPTHPSPRRRIETTV